MKVRDESGFTLVEIIVVAAIIAVLAGVLIPMIFGQIDEAKLSRAEADIKGISTAILTFRKDVGRWPKETEEGCTDLTFMAGAGNNPSGLAAKGFDTSATEGLEYQLNRSSHTCYNNFNGPYINEISADPWGNAYFLAADNYDNDDPVYVLSAGPDGVVDTNADIAVIQNDDIGLRVK